jgi:hypothetical protein
VASVGVGGIVTTPVYLLTSLAQTASGARVMAQMEVTPQLDKWSFSLGGALTFAGPSPTFGSPMSAGLVVNGTDWVDSTDKSSCGEAPLPAKPAIGVFDDPNNPTSPTALDTVINSLGKPQNYIGAHAAPDVENVFTALGGTNEAGGLADLTNTIKDMTQNGSGVYYNASDPAYGGTVSNFDLGHFDSGGNCARPAINFIDGNAIMGPQSGCGLLVVTGNLEFHGDYNWKGLILIIGKGSATFNGGGNGQVTGAVFIANLNGPIVNGVQTLGSPTANYAGGGGNAIQYDHCNAENMLAKVPHQNFPSKLPTKIISLRYLDY